MFKKITLVALSIVLPAAAASAQTSADDFFAGHDEEATGEAAGAGIANQATQVLFTAPGVATGGGAYDQQYKNPVNPQWENFDDITGERVEDTYEMKMRAENAKPLPKHDPFSNRMGEIEGRFKKKQK